MKQELKEIVGYLPYGVKIKTKHGVLELTELVTNSRWRMWATFNGKHDSSEFNANTLLRLGLNGKGYKINEAKLILRPLSDLTKQMPGKECSYIQELNEIDGWIIDIENDLDIEINGFFNLLESIEPLNFLYQHHFDIHNLIEQKKAIDINTLEI